MHLLRTRFKKDIVCEFLPPSRRLKNEKVLIFAGGMPGFPSKKRLAEFWSKKNYWVFIPRYRGTWESDGKFLKQSPTKDVLDVIDGLSKGFKEAWSRDEYRVEPKKLHILASSFGGPAGILASRDERVDKVIAISPVVDWTAPSKEEPLDFLYRFIKEGFGQAYRIDKRTWNKLESGKFYNPVNHIDEFNSDKIFIIHADDDNVVLSKYVKQFAGKLGCRFKLYKRGGHLGSSIVMKEPYYTHIRRFLNGHGK